MRLIGPVSRRMTVESVGPIPGTLVNKPYCGRGLTRSCRRFSRTSICDCSVAITALLALGDKLTSAASGTLSILSAVCRFVWVLVVHPAPCLVAKLSPDRSSPAHAHTHHLLFLSLTTL